MTGQWEDVVAGEIGVGAKVTVFPFKTGTRELRIKGVVDALWIPAQAMQAFPGEVRARVKVAPEHGSWWIGPSTFLEAVI